MCHLVPCADPTGEGVWWRDDAKWCLYGTEHQNQIRGSVSRGHATIDLGVITSKVHPNGQRYTLDLNRMEQVAVSSGQRRPVKIIDRPAPVLALPSTKTKPLSILGRQDGGPRTTFPRVHYRDSSGRLKPYDQEISNALLQLAVSGKQTSLTVPCPESGKHLHFDLEGMKQYFLDARGIMTDESPREVVIECPWNPEGLIRLIRTAESAVRRKIFILTIEKLRSDEHLDEMLPKEAYPRSIMDKKALSEAIPGSSPYEQFVDALEDNFSTRPREIEAFISLTSPDGDWENSIVQIVYRPAPKHAQQQEMNQRSNAFWLSMAAPIAAAQSMVYGSVVLNILVSLVILPRSAATRSSSFRSCRAEAMATVERPNHCLSLMQLGLQ